MFDFIGIIFRFPTGKYEYFIMTFFYVEPGRRFTIPLNMLLLYAVGKHNILLGTGTRKENNLLTLHDVVETTTTTVFPGF